MANYTLQKVRNEEGMQTDGKGNKVLNYRGANSRIACSGNKHGAVTGLSKEQETYYENVLNLDKGTLNRNSKFWDDWCVLVDAGGLQLNDEEPKDALDIIVLKTRETVGYTLEDARKSEVKFILTSEDHSAKLLIDSRTFKVKAFTYYGNMSEAELVEYLTAIGRRTAGLSPDAIKALVGDDVELSPKKFLETVEDADKDLKAFVYSLVHAGLLTKDATAFRDAHTKDILGYRLDTVVEYLRNPENQPYYITKQKELTKSKKAK